MNLIIEDKNIKMNYFKFIKDNLKVPCCLRCGKLFNLGFSNKEESLPDYLICVANSLICTCENSKKVEKIYRSQGDSSLSIENYYR